MIAFKGFDGRDGSLTSIHGNGIREKCTFEPGKTYTEEKSKTAREGFHCCENPFECLAYYPLNGRNRYFRVEAAGDIDEDSGERIACTQITLLEELSPSGIAYYGMRYMVEHPDRENWRQDHLSVQVKEERAEADSPGHIAVARGRSPRVRGVAGSILGLVEEDEQGIRYVKLLSLDIKKELAGKWLGFDEEGWVMVLEDETD